MKKVLIFAMVAIVISLMFVSCKSQDEPVVNLVKNEAALKAKLALIPNPSKEEMLKFLSTQEGVQKVSTDQGQEIILTEIFPLDSNTYQIVGDNLALKYFINYDLDSNGNRLKMLTIGQVFNIIDGKIDETNYTFNVQIGCNFSRFFYFENYGNVQQITYYFRFNNGNQFSYFGNYSNSNQVKLPPIAGGKWQLKVGFFDGDLFQLYMSEYIDYYKTDIIKLRFEIKPENIKSLVYLNKKYIKNSYNIQFVGKDDDGNVIAVSYLSSYDESLPEIISFNTPIKVLTRVVICYVNDCIHYSLKVNANSPADGSKIFYDLDPGIPIVLPAGIKLKN